MAKHIKGVEFCSAGYHASRIVEAASAAYWLEGHGDEYAFSNQRDEIRKQLDQLCALMGLCLVDADPDPRPLPNLEDA